MKKISLTIDSKIIEADEGMTILEAALAADMYIPHLCHHPDLRDVGECKMCVVEIEKKDGVFTSCTTPVEDGMVIQTRTNRLKQIRNLSMELILASHPSECTECPKYLKCELQNLIQYLGVSDARLRKLQKNYSIVTENPLFVRDMKRCILCGRCVRACQELRGCNVLQYKRDNEKTYIGSEHGGLLADDNCRLCTACVAVCPTGALMDKTEVLSKFPILEENLLPCKASCPAGTDVPKYVRLIKEGKYAGALAVIRQKAPFPLTLGYVCTAFCEGNCRRNYVNGAVSIRELKKVAALHDNGLWKKNSKMAPSTGKRVAVIGAGPAGLTAAYYLAKQGHEVTVYEKLPIPGGMLSVGIPEYRLPRSVIEAEIEEIQNAGVKILTNTTVDSINTLLQQGYSAVLVAIGTHKGARLPIEGKDLDFVMVNTDFLRDVSQHKKVAVGESVLVLGGGNVAFDCARTAKRLGAKKVMLACLEDRNNMTASDDEIEEGIEEEIEIYNSKSFLRILSMNGKHGVVCSDVESFSFDESKRLVVKTVPGSESTIFAETVIFAAGQSVDVPEGFDLQTGRGGTFVVNSYMTSKEGVFAAGDDITGTTSVVQAIAGGRGAASAMDKYLGGTGNIDEVLVDVNEPDQFIGEAERFAYDARVKADCIAAEQRMKSFDEYRLPFDECKAHCEAERCMQCDLRLDMKKVKFWGDYSIK